MFCFLFTLLALVAVDSSGQPPKRANRLSKETSPYLIEHAHNPVDWFPWGEEALAKARREGKLIFLSIGYSSCHWCHVMERETFEDAEVARFLNEHFVCIKVDREERPDIDAIYMTALQVYHQLAGRGRGGGWPLSMFLTPQAEPFVGGTYFPARDGDREGLPGFLNLVQKIHEVWSNEPDRIRGDAQTVVKFTKAEMEKRSPPPGVKLGESLLTGTLEALAEEYDPKYGGFGYTPDGRRRAQQPAVSDRSGASDGQRAGQTDARRHAGKNVTGRYPRSFGRRLSSLQRRSLLADSAFRKDAVRQRPACRRLCTGL
jgi:uncharacterized protein YyaL (SSP411 family)